MFDLKAYLDTRRQSVETELDRMMPAETTRPTVLHRAMRYSVMAGGKRLRPILCMAACESVGGHAQTAVLPGIAIEILHAYTLIHDDLPCMDDDELRRGRPTSHMVFGEANALLAGDALLTLAFEWLAQATTPAPHHSSQLVFELATASGSQGVIGGQVEDLAAENQAANADLVDYIHRHKTAALLRASVRMGGICGGATPVAMEALTRYGECAGLAFQIADDILNVTSTAEQLGKPVGNDEQLKKLTYVAVHGLEASRQKAQELITQAVEAIRIFPGDPTPLIALAEYTVKRAW